MDPHEEIRPQDVGEVGDEGDGLGSIGKEKDRSESSSSSSSSSAVSASDKEKAKEKEVIKEDRGLNKGTAKLNATSKVKRNSWSRKALRWLRRIWSYISLVPVYQKSPYFYYNPTGEIELKELPEQPPKLTDEEFVERMSLGEDTPPDSIVNERFPTFSKMMTVAGYRAAPGCSKWRMFVPSVIHTAFCALLLVYEIVFFISRDLMVTLLLGSLLLMSVLAIWCSTNIYHTGHFQRSIAMVPPRKQFYLKRLDRKHTFLSCLVVFFSLVLGIAFFAVKYIESTKPPEYFAIYFLYLPVIYVLILTIAFMVLQTDLNMVIINDYLQIIQTAEVRAWSIYQLIQMHLKYVRNHVEQTSYKWRLFLLFMLFGAMAFIVADGYLLLFQKTKTVLVILARLGVLVLGMILLFYLMFPGSSVSDRARKCVKYINIGLASGHILCSVDERLSILMYLQLSNVMFKIYGIGLTRGFVLNTLYVIITFLVITLQRIAVLFDF